HLSTRVRGAAAGIALRDVAGGRERGATGKRAGGVPGRLSTGTGGRRRAALTRPRGAGLQRTRFRVIRLTMANSTTAPRNETSSPARLMSPELMVPAPTMGLMSQPPRKAPTIPTTM